MKWNWQLPEWPNFVYETNRITPKERQFLLGSGSALVFLKNIPEKELNQFVVEILSLEGLESSKIEGEILERESLQSSIQQHFGLQKKAPAKADKEFGMAEVLCNVYDTFDRPLTHEMMWEWHSMLFKGWSTHIEDCGKYRTHPDPMQIVSGRLDARRVFYEAPPSINIPREMEQFVSWFNSTRTSIPVLIRASIAHVYFESIHPFEDGNGRIGRVLAEKVLSQGIGKPVLIAISKCIEKNKKKYYSELGKCNKSLEASDWVEFFADIILQAQSDSMKLLHFLIEKSKIFAKLSGEINPRQEKVLLRMFAEGPEGFSGGLSAEKYMAITNAPRATTTRDLADLVQKGALVKTGELRHTRYRLRTNSNNCR